MSNYYEQQEQIDNQCFELFNERTKWFTSITRQDHFNRIDYLCVDKKNRNVSVELKTRFVDINKYETLFIEPDKHEALIYKYDTEGYLPIYINFLQDADHVSVFDLRKFNNENTTTVSKIILDKGDGQCKKVDRMLLDTKQGHYYEWDNNKYKLIW